MKKKLVIISIDAMGAEDLSGDLKELPTLKNLIEMGTHVEQVKAIYPSLTYPSHTTIVTGVYPKTHGIVNNTKIQPKRKSPGWFWYKKDVKVPTLYERAKEKGLSTAAFLWPVTAKSKIDWNVAEIFPNRIWANQVLVSLQASSPWFLLQMEKKYSHLRDGIKQPQLDDFVTACAADTLSNKKPDLCLVHLVDMDSMRHRYGVKSQEAKAALKRQDKRVAELIEATKKAGTYQDTTFAILGDHYQIDVDKMIRLNCIFSSKGWLQEKQDGAVEKWEVYAKSCDGSCYIYQKENSLIKPEEIRRTLAGVKGIETIYTSQEVSKFGGDPSSLYMVEAKRGFYFLDEAVGQFVEEVEIPDMGQPERYKAVHGFSPLKDHYDTTLILIGPTICTGKKIKEARLVDEAPTFARILEVEMPTQIEGVVLKEAFKL